jgi:hypothetical protein
MSEQNEVRASEATQAGQQDPPPPKKQRAKRVRKAGTPLPTGELNVESACGQVVAALNAAGWSAAYVEYERGGVCVKAKRGQVLAGPYACGDVQPAEQLAAALHAAKVARVVLKVGRTGKTGTSVRGRSVGNVLTA